MKNLLFVFLFLQSYVHAQVNMPFGKNHRIIYHLKEGTYTLVLNGKIIIDNAYAASQHFDSRTSVKRSYTKKKHGTGTLLTINSGSLQQLFYTYSDHCEIVVRVAGVACNYISPLNTPAINAEGRILNVPFDNDMWFRYEAPPLSKANFTSSEVTAIYNDKEGIVIGSLEQDVWKTGIQVSPDGLKVICGFTDSLRTHDNRVHGTVQPVNGYCSSAPIFIGYNKDWRAAMETYAGVHSPDVTPWKGATPVCWNSWGVIQTKIDLAKAKSVVNFFHDSCPGYRTTDNTLYIDLDSYWDNLRPDQLKEFAAYCKEKGFKPGIYWAPFVDWGKYDRPVEGGTYRYKDTWILQNGHPADLDGGRAMDPTHPATRQRIMHFMGLFKAWGYEMVKIDFLSHGALENDHFYDPAVTTGMQAFSKGMELVDSVAGNMLLYAAISPNLATSRYVHMRRIACDAFSSIDNTEYTLNSTAYGWWLSKMYPYLDADHVVFKDASFNTNKARFASALVTGTLTVGDDYAADGPWKNVAKQLLQDKELLAVSGKTFRPLDSNIFIRDHYIAIFNFGDKEQVYRVPVQALSATELFSKETIPVRDTLTVKVEAASAAIYSVK